MKSIPISMVSALAVCTVAALVWVSVVWFSFMIDASAAASADAITKARQDRMQLDADSAAIALAAATADGRTQLSRIMNKDALSLSNVLTTAGADANVKLTIGNVTQGPGPALPKGALLHPASFMFSVHGDGSFQKLFALTALLFDLPVASSLERVQLSKGSADNGWVLQADVRVITNNPL